MSQDFQWIDECFEQIESNNIIRFKYEFLVTSADRILDEAPEY